VAVTTTHHVLKDPTATPEESIGALSITLVTQSLPVSLFATCHQIHAEAKPILVLLFDKLRALRAEPTRIIMGFPSREPRSIPRAFLECLDRCIETIPSTSIFTSPRRNRPPLLLSSKFLPGSPAYMQVRAFAERCVRPLRNTPANKILFAINFGRQDYVSQPRFRAVIDSVFQIFKQEMDHRIRVGSVIKPTQEWKENRKSWESYHRLLHITRGMQGWGYNIVEDQELVTEEAWARDWEVTD
jgi:hypothetical protein